jgi:hypothetical protein
MVGWFGKGVEKWELTTTDSGPRFMTLVLIKFALAMCAVKICIFALARFAPIAARQGDPQCFQLHRLKFCQNGNCEL